MFLAQLPNLHHVPWAVYPLLAGGLAIMVFFPKLTKVAPAPLVAIIVLTAITIGASIAVPTVGDKGKLPSSLPTLGLPHVPYNLHTLSIIALPAVTMALVGLLESLLTARLVDYLTTPGRTRTVSPGVKARRT